MKIRYLLKKRGNIKGASHPIYVALYDHDTTELIYTGQRIMKTAWSKNEQLPQKQDSDVYTNIDAIKKAVVNVMRRMMLADKVITPYAVKKEYNETRKARQDEQRHADAKDKVSVKSVSSLIERWKKAVMDEYQISTRRTLTISIDQFKQYLKVSGQMKLEKKDISPEIIKDYAIDYLQKKRKLADSTHAKRMKHLRMFLKWADVDPAVIKDIKIRTIKPSERNIISLTQAELQSLETFDVSHDKELQRSKDMFLLGCYTGLRVSDLKRINRHRINEDKIHLTLQKNRKEVTIPILSHTRAILERYENAAPKISEQQVNRNIKDICADCGIDKPVMFKSKRNGLLVEKLYAKHELITTHVAGKTFITLAPDRWGFTPADVAAFVGKDLKTVLGYYMRPDQEAAIRKMIEGEARAEMKKVS